MVTEPGQNQLSEHLIGFMADIGGDRNSQTAAMEMYTNMNISKYTI